MTWQEYKERVVKSMKGEGKKRVIIATSALSMGVNFPDIRFVVHWGPAHNLLDHHQQSGRAGRDGLTSDVVVIYHGHQLIHCEDVKAFVHSDDCLRVDSYNLSPLHSCSSSTQPSNSEDWGKIDLLLGKPGTGKSQVLIRIVHECFQCRLKSLILTPVALLATRYRDLFGTTHVEANTIHSAFNIPVNDKQNHHINFALEGYDILIVDEASIIGANTFHLDDLSL